MTSPRRRSAISAAEKKIGITLPFIKNCRAGGEFRFFEFTGAAGRSVRNQTSGRGFNPLPKGAKLIPTRYMAHEKLLRLLNILWLLLVLPVAVAVSVGFVGHSATLGIKTFLLIEFGIAILSPLLSAILGSRDPSHRKRGK